jgi:hypothetical protein
VFEEWAGRVDVLDDFEEGYDVECVVWRRGLWEGFDRCIEIPQPPCLHEQRISSFMSFSDLEDFGRRVDCGHGRGMWEARSAFGEDPAAAPDIEVPQFLRGRAGGGGAAGVDEGVAQRVHEVQESRGAVGVPPAGGERVEVRYFCGVDGARVRGGRGIVARRGGRGEASSCYCGCCSVRESSWYYDGSRGLGQISLHCARCSCWIVGLHCGVGSLVSQLVP